ncbi:MAG: RNA polymerase sigma factor [Pelotomaculum sp. PtaU1.Bin035]|nr:MAG: RNA polymerase sigma factor [Pelotomaculum sp. PtaU1.Bin035]
MDLAEKVPSLEKTPWKTGSSVRKRYEELGNAILRLPEKQKDLLYFKYILEMADAEIAEIFGIAPDSVRQYLTRARREAKKLMDKEVNKHA